MATLVYATSANYTAWTGGAAPANIANLLRAASLSVTEATELCFYAHDTTGMPTDAVILQTFNDATCCQAAFLAAINYDPLRGGVAAPGITSSQGIGSARMTYADAKALAETKLNSVMGLCLDAQRILANGNLVPSNPWIV